MPLSRFLGEEVVLHTPGRCWRLPKKSSKKSDNSELASTRWRPDSTRTLPTPANYRLLIRLGANPQRRLGSTSAQEESLGIQGIARPYCNPQECRNSRPVRAAAEIPAFPNSLRSTRISSSNCQALSLTSRIWSYAKAAVHDAALSEKNRFPLNCAPGLVRVSRP